MFSTLGRLLAAGILLVGLSGLSGCGLLDGSSRLEEALEYLPADAAEVVFVDRASVAERLDLDGLKAGASEDELAEWMKDTQEDGYGTELSRYLIVMQKAAFTDLDVEWEATANGDDLHLVVWKLNDDVDFDKVADDLQDAGFERSGNDDHPTFTADLSAAGEGGLLGDRYPAAAMQNLALVPDEHLVITGNVEAGIDVAMDEADSLSDKGSFDDLLDEAPDQDALEFAAMTLDPPCSGGRLSAEQLDALQDRAGDLGRPDSIGLYAAPEERVTVARLFGDEDDAEAEAQGLEDFLDESGRRTGLDVDFDVERDGAAVLVEADFDDRRRVVAAWQRLDGPFTCLPS